MIRLSGDRCRLTLLISVFVIAAMLTGVSSRRRRPCETVCTRDCPFGYLSYGCPRCNCAPDPCANNYCRTGATCIPTPKKNCGHRGGCPCEAVCVRGVCNDTCANVQCEFGFKLKGCPRCECATNPCDSITCPVENVCQARRTRCPFKDGCPHMGVCRPRVCEHTCNANCQYGFLSQGCPRCQCAGNPCESKTCGPGEQCTVVSGTCNFAFGCPAEGLCVASVCDSTCAITCPYGFLPEGCPRCKCASNPCQGMTCPGEFECHVQAPPTCNYPSGGCMFEAVCKPKVCEETCARQCTYGYKPKGCPRCDCVTNPCDGVICPPDCICFAEPGNCTRFTSCPYIPVCKLIDCNDTCGIDCPYGYLSEGCPRCKCAQNPCDGIQCPVGMSCQPTKSDCKFHHQCPHTAECVPDTCEEFCNKNCPFGFKSNMCPRCECLDNPCRGVHCGIGMRCFAVDEPCQFERHCPNIANCTPAVCAETCQKYCPYGFLEDGCPRCQCAPDPCLNVACNGNERCVTTPGTCAHGQCPHIGNCLPSVCADTCQSYCPYGFLEVGCPRCQCAPDPCQNVVCNGNERCATTPGTCVHGQCPHIGNCVPSVCSETCQKYCPYGFLEDGCPRCQCAPNPCQNVACNGNERCVTTPGTCVHGQCPHIGNCEPSVCAETCQKYCPYGFLEDGCPRCQCSPDPCLTVACIGNNRCVATPATCVYGNCPHIGICEPSVCPPVCNKHCPYGFLEEGCPRCTCAQNPCDIHQCTAAENCFTQEGQCASGNNCAHIINCVPKVCESTCSKHCPYGFEAEGCPRCTCASDPCLPQDACLPGQTCTVENAVLCPFLTGCKMSKICLAGVCEETCTKYCPYGFLSAGCPRCTCAPNPCLDHQCPVGEECMAEQEVCMFNEGCPHKPICKRKACEEVCTGSNCRYGYLPNTCPRCDCAPDPCPNVTCGRDQTCITLPSQCEFRTGCPAIARCVMLGNVCEQCCDRRCQFGFTLRGCPRCDCAPDPCQGVICGGPGQFCEASPSTCGFRYQCPHTAVCRPRPQVCEATCKTFCPYGFVSDGCPRCTCQVDPCLNTSCQAGEVCRTTPAMCRFTTMCPHKAVCVPENAACPWTCWRWCPFGFLTSGCPRCECAPDPCLDTICGPNEGCVPRPSTCSQLWGCPFDAVCIQAPFNKCFQSPMSGSCNQSIPGYYYDPHVRDCRAFRYSGCGGNDNKFLHQSTCKRRCNAVGYKFRRYRHNPLSGYSRYSLHGFALGMDVGAGETVQSPIAEWTIDIPTKP